jgi:hypothetical protein
MPPVQIGDGFDEHFQAARQIIRPRRSILDLHVPSIAFQVGWRAGLYRGART